MTEITEDRIKAAFVKAREHFDRRYGESLPTQPGESAPVEEEMDFVLSVHDNIGVGTLFRNLEHNFLAYPQGDFEKGRKSLANIIGAYRDPKRQVSGSLKQNQDEIVLEALELIDSELGLGIGSARLTEDKIGAACEKALRHFDRVYSTDPPRDPGEEAAPADAESFYLGTHRLGSVVQHNEILKEALIRGNRENGIEGVRAELSQDIKLCREHIANVEDPIKKRQLEITLEGLWLINKELGLGISEGRQR